MESPRKRPRAEQKGGSRKRGRPRKSEVTPEIPFLQEETAPAQEGPAVVVVPEPVEVIPAQASGSLTPLLAVGSDMFESPLAPVIAAPEPVIAAPAPVIAAPAPVIAAPAPMLFGSLQSPLFAPTLISRAPAPVNPTPAFVSPSILAPAKVLDTASVPTQDSSPAPDAVPVPAVSRDPVPAVAQVETLYTESQDRVALDQVLIEDLGPDDEDDIPPTQDKGADEGINLKGFRPLSIACLNSFCQFISAKICIYFTINYKLSVFSFRSE